MPSRTAFRQSCAPLIQPIRSPHGFVRSARTHTQPGAMVYMSNEVQMGAKWGGFRAVMGGEALAKVTYTNTASEEGYVGVSPNLPMGVVVPIDLTDVSADVARARGGQRGPWVALRGRSHALGYRRALAQRTAVASYARRTRLPASWASSTGVRFTGRGGSALPRRTFATRARPRRVASPPPPQRSAGASTSSAARGWRASRA